MAYLHWRVARGSSNGKKKATSRYCDHAAIWILLWLLRCICFWPSYSNNMLLEHLFYAPAGFGSAVPCFHIKIWHPGIWRYCTMVWSHEILHGHVKPIDLGLHMITMAPPIIYFAGWHRFGGCVLMSTLS